MTSEEIGTRPDFFAVTPASAAEATEVAPGVWMSPGLSNAWLLTTPAGRVVVNTGMGFEASTHRRNFDAVDSSPIRYVLVTQGHVDHVGGVERFLDDDTIFVAHAACRACQDDDARIHRFRVRRSLPFFAAAIGAADEFIRSGGDVPDVAPQARPEPSVVFEDDYEFELGGRRFRLLSTPGGETIDSLTVWLPDERVAIVGNLFSALFGHFPNLVTMRGDRYRFVTPFLESLDCVRSLQSEVLCVGHFDPIRGRDTIDRELARIDSAVRWVHDATVSAMNRGGDVWAAMREIRLPTELEIGEGYGRVSWAVRAIWEGYAGWFHHHSTTELYGVPPDNVSSELTALAGGADVVARRSAELTHAEPVRAIGLADAALSHDPTCVAALTASRAAHLRLLELHEGANFWETRWLAFRIAQLEHRIEEVG